MRDWYRSGGGGGKWGGREREGSDVTRDQSSRRLGGQVGQVTGRGRLGGKRGPHQDAGPDSRSPSVRRPGGPDAGRKLADRDRGRPSRSRSVGRHSPVRGGTDRRGGSGYGVKASGRGPPLRGTLPRRRLGPEDAGERDRRQDSREPRQGQRLRLRDNEDYGSRRRPETGDREAQNGSDKGRLKLDNWFLAVQLLLNWDDQKTMSASEMEELLSRFLEDQAKQQFGIAPQTSSGIFLRGVLRNLWDIDRFIRLVNSDQEEELKRITAANPWVLSILRVLAYELMWMPEGDVKTVKDETADLMQQCKLSANEDRDWLLEAVVRMRKDFDNASKDWARRARQMEQRKRRKREDKKSGGEEADQDVESEAPQRWTLRTQQTLLREDVEKKQEPARF